LLVVSGIAAALFAGSIALVRMSVGLEAARANADTEKSKAEEARAEEEKERKRAEVLQKRAEDLQNSLQILLAGKGWESSQLSRTEQLLDRCPAEYHALWEWRFLKHQCHLDLLTLPAQNRGITGVAFGPDGSRLAAGSMDGIVKVWNIVTGR